MDDDSLDELAEWSAGPGGPLPSSPPAVASDAEGSSDGNSRDSEDDTSSEQRDGTDEDEDLEDRSGSEDSDEGDVEGLVTVADARKRELGADRGLSSDDEAESCPICLNAFRDQAVGTPETCAHWFCLDCIAEWSKNANSCPVDRTIFKFICARTRFGGKIVRKIPVENTGAPAAEEEDPTFCEVCGRSDREDRLLLCDGCDAGYHMECLEPPLQEVPVNEWFCPECAAPGAGPGSDPGHVSAEEVTLLLADVVPTTSRLRPSTGRTRAIARTRQSERVRAAVDRNRVTAARRVQRVPRYLMSSQLDETIEAVVSGLSTAVYQRPATPRAPAKRRRKAGRRRKALGRKKAAPSKSSVRSQSSGTRSKKRQSRRKRRKGKKLKVRDEVTARDRIARTLGLRRPVHGASFPSVYKPTDPSLGLMRADIGAASLSLFGDPHELDPFDSGEEPSTNPASPLSAKRRVLSRSALRSHQPVARPISMTLCRRGVPAATAPESEAEAAPVPDLLGSILSGQSLLMMDGADVVIHRDGSLSAKRAAPAAFQRSSLRVSGRAGDCRSGCQQPAVPPSGSPAGDLSGSGPKSSPLISHSGPAPAPTPAPASRLPAHTARPVVRLGPAAASRPGTLQAQSLASNMLGSHRGTQPWSNRDGKCAPPVGSTSPGVSGSDPHPPLRRPIPSLKSAPGRRDISELPRIPKIKRDIGSGHVDSAPAPGPSAEIPSSCISRLTGREGPAQPGHGPRAEGQSSGRGPAEPSAAPGGPQPTAPSSHSSLAPVGAARGKGMGSTFESFRINIPGNTAPAGRLAGPSFCNTFRPVDNKAQRKENPAPLFSLKKPKQLKSEIYDPFDPTGSDSSSAGSSPERPGAALLPSEITRTISVRSPRAPACQTVRCVTTYTVEGASEEAPETSRRPAPSGLRLQDGEAGGSSSDLEPEGLVLSGAAEGEGMPRHSVFFDTKARTVTCVTAMEPSAPPSPDTPPPTTHRIVELHSPSPARSSASSCGQKGAKRGKASTRETRETRSRSRSGSRSRERSSRSASPSASEPHTRKSRPKARAQRSSSEGSSSHDRAKRKKAKDRGREKKRSSWGTRRSRSASPGSSSHERHEGRKKKAQRPSSRSRGREGTPPSSLERSRRHKRRRERSRERSRERPDRKEGASRSRGRRRSRERRAWRSRSPSTEHRAREQRRPHSRERQPRTHSHSPCRKQPAKEASPPPVYDASQPDGGPAPEEVLAALPVVPAAGVAEASVEAPPVPEGPPGSAPDDLDYGDSVEAGHIFDDFPTEAIFIQLDDMSSPPSPESTDSSPERAPLSLPPVPGRARDGDLDPGRALAAIQREVSLIHSDGPQPSLQAESLPEGVPREQDTGVCQAVGTLVAGSEGPQEGEVSQPEEAAPQMPLMRTKAPVKRVTWNLQDEGGDTPAADRVPRALPHRLQRPRDTAWDMEDLGLAPFSQAPPFCEMMPPSQAAPELAFPDTDTSQVYSPALPVTLALPPGGPPCMPVSQPAAQFLLQGSLPLVGCGGAQVLTPMPSTLTTTSEPAVLAPVTNSLEEKTSASKPPGEKAKTEEYMKKLHTQERAVEEVKLAIKPFYQRREVTKEEYKDILRKAVQKICHSKSGEINPMKVANLVRAYVEKYRHMRRHRKAGPEEGPPPEAEG